MITKALILSALTFGSIASPCLANVKTQQIVETKQEDSFETEACSMMYVGKNVSKDGCAIIARSSDANPNEMNHSVHIFNHNEFANKTITGKNGFAWKMPSTTYRYISTPRSKVMNKGHHWEVSGINENGVGVSATLTCFDNDAAEAADPVEPNGISEDNITGIVAAVSKTARDGVKYLTHILDTVGSAEHNACMIIDQQEAWYVEMYTGHQYVAVKMPDDKACTIGNEFMLNTLEDFKDEDIIPSPNLFKLAIDNKFAVFEGGTDNKHMHLFKTYAKALTNTPEDERITNDNCHRRTWRGYSLFAQKDETSQSYSSTEKYEPFFTPDNDLGVEDVIKYMRDKFENLLNNPDFKEFKTDFDNHVLRPVGTENGYQVHIIKSHPDLPKEISCEEWLCLSGSNYCPFIPLCNGMTKFNDYYTYQSENYGYDEKSVCCRYRDLYALGFVNRDMYGKQVEKFWTWYEWVIQQHYNQILEGVKGKSLGYAKKVISNYLLEVQNWTTETVFKMANDLMFHIMDDNKSTNPNPTLFNAFVSAKAYAELYGWKYQYNKKEMKATLTQGNDSIIIEGSNQWNVTGKIIRNATHEVAITTQIKDNELYIPIPVADTYLAAGRELVDINIGDYDNHELGWIIPVSILTPISVGGIGAATVHYLSKKRKILVH